MNEFDFSKFDFSKIEGLKKPLSSLERQSISVPDFSEDLNKLQDEVIIQNQEKYIREVENNESLKSIVAYNEEILNRNKELVSLNNKILTKINSLDSTLSFLNSSFSEKRQEDKDNNVIVNAKLLELITLIEDNDKSKLAEFFCGLTGDVAAGLITAFLQMKLGLS